MQITSVQYTQTSDTNDGIKAVIDGQTRYIPLDPDNRHYAAILEWAEEDGNEIQAAK